MSVCRVLSLFCLSFGFVPVVVIICPSYTSLCGSCHVNISDMTTIYWIMNSSWFFALWEYLFSLFLQLPEKKVVDPNGPYISTFQTNLRNLCREFRISVCHLSSSVYLSGCRPSAAYTSPYKGLKYSLKVKYIILNYPNNVAKFLIFKTLCLGRAKTLICVSQNVCLIKTHILIYWHARFNCKL